MKVEWKKRAMGYAVLVAMAGGLIYLLSATPMEVQVQVDLSGAQHLGASKLSELTVRFPGAGGQDSQVLRFSFPESIYPAGPPLRISPVTVRLTKGTHEVVVDFTYGSDPGAVSGTRTVLVHVERDAPLTIKLGD